MPLLDTTQALKQDIIYLLGRYVPSMAAHFKSKPTRVVGQAPQQQLPQKLGVEVSPVGNILSSGNQGSVNDGDIGELDFDIENYEMNLVNSDNEDQAKKSDDNQYNADCLSDNEDGGKNLSDLIGSQPQLISNLAGNMVRKNEHNLINNLS